MSDSILRDRMLSLYDYYKESGYNLDNLTVWDIFIQVIPDSTGKYVAHLKADLPILELLTRGLTPDSVSRTLGIKSSAVVKVARSWNIKTLLEPLDIDPLLVYNRGMDLEEFSDAFLDASLKSLDARSIERIYDNIYIYFSLLDFLEEIDE